MTVDVEARNDEAGIQTHQKSTPNEPGYQIDKPVPSNPVHAGSDA